VIEHGKSSQCVRPSDRKQRGNRQADRGNGCGICDGGGNPPTTGLQECGKTRIGRRFGISPTIGVKNHTDQIVGPIETMIHNRRMLADEALGSAITLRKGAAEFVDGCFGVDADGQGVLPHVGAGVDSRRPPRQIISFETTPEIHGDSGRFREFF
jgi:hypothetical protein